MKKKLNTIQWIVLLIENIFQQILSNHMVYYFIIKKKEVTENKLTFKIIWSNQGMDDKIIPIANVKIPTRITASRPATKKFRYLTLLKKLLWLYLKIRFFLYL